MDKFLKSLGFERIDQSTWRRRANGTDLLVLRQTIGDTEFVYLRHGDNSQIQYWQSRTLGLSFVELRTAIIDAIERQKAQQR